MSLKFAAQLLRIATGVKRVRKWTNMDTTSELRTMPRGSWDVPEHSTCIHLELNVITSTKRRRAGEHAGV
jgi:hypothetical protein